MAATFRVGRGRRTNIPKQVYLPEARASANEVGRVLVGKYGQHPWILQIMEGVQAFVDRAIQQLGASAGPSQNSQPGDLQQGYAMPARTREDVVQQNPQILQQPSDIQAPNNQQLVQQGMQQDNNDMFAVLSRAADPAAQELGHGIPNQQAPQPMQATPTSQSGLVMPQGPAPQPLQETPDEGADSGHGTDPVSWLL